MNMKLASPDYRKHVDTYDRELDEEQVRKRLFLFFTFVYGLKDTVILRRELYNKLSDFGINSRLDQWIFNHMPPKANGKLPNKFKVIYLDKLREYDIDRVVDNVFTSKMTIAVLENKYHKMIKNFNFKEPKPKVEPLTEDDHAIKMANYMIKVSELIKTETVVEIFSWAMLSLAGGNYDKALVALDNAKAEWNK